MELQLSGVFTQNQSHKAETRLSFADISRQMKDSDISVSSVVNNLTLLQAGES
jgi:hypothetical protein